MKKLFLVLSLAFLTTACTNNSNFKDGVVMEPINTVALGETCGGPDKIKCGSGLACNEKNPTKTGQCIALSAKDIECSQEKKPVCGLKDNNKNGYLNPCEADRHGAEVLYEGFCKEDENIAGNCEASGVSMGNCEAFFMGAQFNRSTGNCEEVGLSGCNAQIPFTDIESCQNACGGSVAQSESNKLQFCPDEKIVNSMPGTVGDSSGSSYYIYQGERKEINEFDSAWIEANCEVPVIEVF